jgi:hypothetical protein
MDPELAVKYLLFAQFCTEITASQLLSVPQNFKGVTHYFFPSLVSASRPSDLNIVLPEDHNYTHSYTWALKCSNPCQFFTPRLLHTLFVQLTKYDKETVNARFVVWKSGILLVRNNGTRSIIEVTDQSTRLYLAMQCVKGYELLLVQQRSELISLILSLLSKVCPKLELRKCLLLPDTAFPPECCNEIPLADVAKSVVCSFPTVLYNYEDGVTPRHVKIIDLLHLDPFHAIEAKILQHLFSPSQSMKIVPPLILKEIISAVNLCTDTIAKKIGGNEGMTYNQVFRELAKYSIFTMGDLYVSCGDAKSQPTP